MNFILTPFLVTLPVSPPVTAALLGLGASLILGFTVLIEQRALPSAPPAAWR